MPDVLARETISAVIDAELELMAPVVRASRPRLEALLHPDFREIGASGTMWSRDEIIQTMFDEATNGEDAPMPQLAAVEVHRIAPALLHLTYESHASSGRTVARSSLWAETDQGLRIVFHQGTLIP